MNEEIEPSIPRSVVVTGASRGIGEAVAKEFLAQGDRVAGISRSGEATDGVLGLAADVTDPEALAQALSVATEAHGTVEVLVASAGVNRESLAARTSSQMWDEVISADLTGTFNTVRAVTPAMMRARRGAHHPGLLGDCRPWRRGPVRLRRRQGWGGGPHPFPGP